MRRSTVSRRFAVRRIVRRTLRASAVVAAAAAGAGLAAWGGLPLLKKLPVFRVQRVEVAGTGYLTRDGVRAAAGVDSATSVWESTDRMAARLESHPMIAAARVERRPPSALAFTVEEAVPVALVAGGVVEPVDRYGNVLPVDPTRPVLDLPLLRVLTRRAASSWGMRVLARDVGHLLDVAPEVFAVVSEARLGDREAALLLGDDGLRVRYVPPLSERRMRHAVIALNDAHERFPQRVAREIDLRFADQVIVRTASAPGGAEEAGRGGAGG